jgi:uncharacterized DUF497 family protein
VRFEWDSAKAESNYAKHGVSFDVARLVFEDPFQRSIRQVIDEEERWVTMGLAGDTVLLVVAHTISEGDDKEEVVRIISARKATSRERKSYEQSN